MLIANVPFLISIAPLSNPQPDDTGGTKKIGKNVLPRAVKIVCGYLHNRPLALLCDVEMAAATLVPSRRRPLWWPVEHTTDSNKHNTAPRGVVILQLRSTNSFPSDPLTTSPKNSLYSLQCITTSVALSENFLRHDILSRRDNIPRFFLPIYIFIWLPISLFTYLFTYFTISPKKFKS